MRDRMEERAREWIKANAPSLCWPDGSIGADGMESLVSLLRAIRREAMEEAARFLEQPAMVFAFTAEVVREDVIQRIRALESHK